MNEQIKTNLQILQIMQTAKEKGINYPSMKLMEKMELKLAGDKSHYPGAINITDGGPWGNNKWYGRINTNGSMAYPKTLMDEEKDIIEEQLQSFANDPAKFATVYGKNTGQCMFCSRKLTNPQSIAVGYGPVCAAYYGLPHGNLDPDLANQMIQTELPIEKTVSAFPIDAYDKLTAVSAIMLPVDDHEKMVLEMLEETDLQTQCNIMITYLYEGIKNA